MDVEIELYIFKQDCFLDKRLQTVLNPISSLGQFDCPSCRKQQSLWMFSAVAAENILESTFMKRGRGSEVNKQAGSLVVWVWLHSCTVTVPLPLLLLFF